MNTEAHTGSTLVLSRDEEILRTIQTRMADVDTMHSAETLHDGLQMLSDLPIRVVLLDQMMPGSAEFLDTLRVTFPTVVVLGIVRPWEVEQGIESVSRGEIYRYIVVPGNPLEFDTIVGQAFERNQLLTMLHRTAPLPPPQTSAAALQRRTVELERSNRKLRRQNDHLSEMLRSAAHDLRNPLGAILAVTELLTTETIIDSDERKEYQSLIHREAESMLRLLNALLDLQKLSVGGATLQRRDVDVQEFMEEVIDSGRRLARRKDVALHGDIPDDLPTVRFDPTHIRRVLDNLIDNAVKFSPPTSAVAIEVDRAPDGIIFAVIDQGPGVREDERHRIFLPFVRGSARPTGNERSTGLGLTICRTIVEQHGGRLEVSDAPGGGSRFHFILPH